MIVNATKPVTLTIQLLLSQAFTSPEEAAALLKILCQEFPEFAPEHWNFFEPVNRPFTGESQKAIPAEWDDPFLFRRADLELNGAVNQRPRRSSRHASIEIDMVHPPENQNLLLGLFYALCRVFKPDIAFMHPLGEAEHPTAIATGMSYVLRKRVFPPRLTTEKLQRGLPNLFWLTVLGPPYVKLLGEDLITAAPAAAVEFLDTDCLALQLTPSWTDFISQYALADAIRERIKHHFGAAIFSPGLTGQARLTPEFKEVDTRQRPTMILPPRRALSKTQIRRRKPG